MKSVLSSCLLFFAVSIVSVFSGSTADAKSVGDTKKSDASKKTNSDKKKKWNYIFIMADDQGYGDLSCFGSKKIKTPHIDKMAQEGMRFTNFYAQMLCGPTRTSLHTGCYPMRVAEFKNEKGGFPYLHVKEILLAKNLQEVGYKTGWIGKMDTTQRRRGYKPELNPTRRGYDFWYGVVGANDGGKLNLLHRNEKILAQTVNDLSTITQKYTTEATQFIERNQKKPFMLYLAHTMPHVQIDCSKKFKGVSKGGRYGDVIEELDWSTGQIIAKIKKLGLEKNTIVIYTSDNGPFKGRKKPEQNGSPGPLRGSKGTTWEGGVRVPCVMWAPGLIPAKTVCKDPVQIMDIFPTFISMAGGKLPADRKIDGKDISPLMLQKPGAKSPHRFIAFYHECRLEAIRSGEWKLVLSRKHPKDCPWMSRSRSYKKFFPGAFITISQHELYHLGNDISESKNVAAQHPKIVAQLKKYAEETITELGDFHHIGKGARFFDKDPKWPRFKKLREEKPRQ